MSKRWIPVCRGCIRRLIGSARFWAVLIVTALYLERVISPIRSTALEMGFRITPQGFLVYLLNDGVATALLMLGCLALLFDLPCTDELQRYLMLRTGRRSWGLGQLAYIIGTVVLYLLAVALICVLILLPCETMSTGWEGMETVVRELSYDGFSGTEGQLYYDTWLLDRYTPQSALGLVLVLHILAFSLVSVLVMILNLHVNRRLGFLLAALPIGMDLLLEEFFPVWVYHFSPMTLSRLSGLDYGDGMGRPAVAYGLISLAVLLWLSGCLFIRGIRRREVLL